MFPFRIGGKIENVNINIAESYADLNQYTKQYTVFAYLEKGSYVKGVNVNGTVTLLLIN